MEEYGEAKADYTVCTSSTKQLDRTNKSRYHDSVVACCSRFVYARGSREGGSDWLVARLRDDAHYLLTLN